ncbi:BAH-domain-containing protein [Suhomyces tanzawaensis NRRL Y-17324]|uniref:BAH-domain-containing protein n=1 Tax=Suhomyces tanzawaensis NRRL Y-17324 TaxID=984487 RepID=A0A1E4SD10_9ASCO|nr:BAH-domain-containing protein [Suhomyces tanzawaensis NRRL Y-17324]ODV77407.1 BAH-domain-containing protein [Suhomyces tanzawaensis NRRL Y-17324]
MSDREKKKLAKRLQGLLDRLYLVEDNGVNVSETFHRLPLRTGTDYYKVVLNPLSLHAIGRKIKKFNYDNAQHFIDDLALVSWNARLYNRKDSIFYRHALILKQFVLTVALPKLSADRGIVNHRTLSYPRLGDLPDDIGDKLTADDVHFSEAPEPREFEHSVTPQSEPYVSTPLSSYQHMQVPEIPPQPSYLPTMMNKLSTPTPSYNKTPKPAESGIRRGRPPIIDKPFETRIKLILKQFKKLRDPNNENRLLTQHFEKLPDSKVYVDYYNRIPNPISLNEIKIKVRTRKYTNVEQFIHDLDVMFANAQMYYETDPYSEEYIDFVNFNKEAQVIIQQEINKSDRELIGQSTSGNDGVIRYPLDSLEVNGFTYKIGDWVLIANHNDPEKPTVGQIFRLWSTEDGNRYTNVCWYYRPEQTCHKSDRLFFKNEVCKTGQYRDHLVNEIVGPCYVVFLTRYQKGDLPEGVVPQGAPWFICEFRYNESSHVFNRIRTWKACLPDEVRDNFEQPLVPLNEPRKLIKYESPIKSLLPADAHIGMRIREPTQGPHTNSPPLAGLVYLAPPVPEDDLGQYISSPNVTRMADHDDHASGRQAFLFTPISQLKGGGGATNTIYTTSHAPIHSAGGVSVESHHSPAPAYEDNSYLPNSYKLLQLQIQENQQKKLQEQQLQQLQHQQHQQLFRRVETPAPTNLIPEGVNYHAVTSAYSTMLAGGVLSYGIEDAGKLADVGDHVNKKIKLVGESEIVFYRAPPIANQGNRIITNNSLQFGHSAKYLAWKARQTSS